MFTSVSLKIDDCWVSIELKMVGQLQLNTKNQVSQRLQLLFSQISFKLILV